MYLFSIFSYAHGIIIDRVVGAPGHVKDVVGGLNATEKRYLSMLITTVQISNALTNNYQILMHTSTEYSDIRLAKEFKKHVSYPSRAYG